MSTPSGLQTATASEQATIAFYHQPVPNWQERLRDYVDTLVALQNDETLQDMHRYQVTVSHPSFRPHCLVPVDKRLVNRQFNEHGGI